MYYVAVVVTGKDIKTYGFYPTETQAKLRIARIVADRKIHGSWATDEMGQFTWQEDHGRMIARVSSHDLLPEGYEP
jgi:hypothetical protein